eukprot:gene26659-biopygen17090
MNSCYEEGATGIELESMQFQLDSGREHPPH